LKTRYGTLANPLHEAWLKSAEAAGYPLTPDVNGYQQEGFGRMDMTVGDGRRWSAANAYLKPARSRSNLAVRTHALVTQVVFEGHKAVGVRYRQGDREVMARARREVILAGGAINSPQLLKLSGVGPGEELARHGLPVVCERRGVGENLQDHLEFYFQVASTKPVTLYSAMNPLAKGLIGAR
jgi:choline dehydrogenase